MLTCHSCLRRSIRSLVILDLQSAHPDVLLPSPTTTSSTRNHATIASIQKGHHLKLLRQAFRKKETPMSRSERIRGPGPVSLRNLRAKEFNKHHLDIRKPDDTTKVLSKYTSDTGLQTELKWTGGDALKLAQAVLDKLKAGIPLQALEMVRLSEKIPGADGSKGVDSVVSWNHIMDYYMSKSLTREAFKVFNEASSMKKRGHKPDAHTYTIMLRGFTMHHRKPHAVEDAMKVYDSIFRPESNIKPSIIHSNAIINCLGRALNMDALWSVAGRLPDRGPGSADKWTYTTILNTMQACAIRDAGQLAETDGDQEAAAKVIQNAIREGRKLWEDVISRWRSGEVNIDQTLVCAMGRLLLLGQRQDWDDIFSLVQQTMGLPRVTPPMVNRHKENTQPLQDALALPPPEADDASPDLEQLELAVADEAAHKVKNEFAVVDLSHRQMGGRDGADTTSPYANVANNVLSLLIEAAIKLKQIPVGKQYWAKLTHPDNEPFVMPDDDNLHSYLRLLRMSRSSKEICDLLRHPVNGALEGVWYRRGTFVIAMSTCARDFKNPNVFTYASTILDLMQSKLSKPDLKIMTMYLSLAMVTTPGISSEIEGEFNAEPGANNLIKAVRRFTYSDLDYRAIVSEWAGDDGEGRNEDEDEADEKLFVGRSRSPHRSNKFDNKEPRSPPEDLLEFMQTLNSAYDKLLNYRLKMTEKLATAFTCQKREVSQALQKLHPEAVSPSRLKSDSEAFEDTFKEQGAVFRSKRYPDKLGRSSDQKIRGPRVVDLEKRHPFRRDLEESEGGNTRDDRRSERGPRHRGREERWQEQSHRSGQDARENHWPKGGSRPPMSSRGAREDEGTGRFPQFSMSYGGYQEDRPPGRGSAYPRSSRDSPGDRRRERASGPPMFRRNNREDRRPERGSPRHGLFKGSGDERRPYRGSDSPMSHRDDRASRRPERDSGFSRGDPGFSRKDNRDNRPARQSFDSSPVSEGWSKAWKQSVEKSGEEGSRKDWVVL
ncbi:hypothetical protein EPUS_01845 [Endocarpon pusillum Z07020]|uniref:Pentatricopeptide repeat protein n=1 Tax=Endocarpon pusillum (strain Z07020 / HMAS-L-300199) TaxID=1263415 RepID=U1GCU2_ENDPU|nr:uncharacterized protein EPUS_01845 [Endocarpon pusillum Z07020]ERF69516.1 hypothetical protein EPUS_01845 [Endocarpon pusillum Z07020]